jgi:hypothetical protein
MKADEDEQALQVAANIKRFRAEWGIAAWQLAAIMGRPANTVQSWENGTRGALGAIYALADAFGRPAEHFRMADPPVGVGEPPAVAFVAIAENVDRDLVQRVRQIVDDVNREHRERRKRGGARLVLAADRRKMLDDLERQRQATGAEKAGRGARQSPAGIQRRQRKPPR